MLMAMGRVPALGILRQAALMLLLLACMLTATACSTLPIGKGTEPPVTAARNIAVPADFGLALEGGPWLLLELNGAVAQLPAGERQPYLLFQRQDGRLTGYAGCNEFTGNYVVQGNLLSFGVFGMTRRFCADTAGDVEQVLLGVLSKVRGWRVEQQMLLILDGDRVLARLRKEQGNIRQ
jgi:heat shock protein HslJ